MDLRFYLSLFLRRLHWFLLFVVIGSAIGLTLARVLPPVYVAQARLLVESEQIPGNLAASTVQTEATEQLEIIQQRILTRDTLLDLANRLGIYADQRADGQAIDANTIVEDMRERISIVTTGGTVARGPAQATLVRVGFSAPTGQMASTVTNELVTLILREDVSMRTGSARQTLDFFEQEVARLDAELAERGSVILAFQEGNQDSLPDSLDFRRSQQTANQERLSQLNREEASLRDRRNSLVNLRQSAESANGVATPTQNRTPEEQQLQALRDELSAALLVLAPSNPKVALLENRVAALEATVEAQRQSQAGVGADGTVLNTFDVQLAEIDAQLDFIADQKTQLQTELVRLRETIEATPGNAITLDTLERDYANVRMQYDQAVANMAQAETGDVIEALSKGQRISVIEQATVPAEPERPNRPIIAAAGVGGGIALGLAVVILLEVLNKGIRRPADLTTALGITVFATLPRYRTRQEILRRRAIIFGVLGSALVGIPVLLWAVNTYYMPLDLLLVKLRQIVA